MHLAIAGAYIAEVFLDADLIKTPAWIALALAKLLSLFLKDVLLRKDELDGLIEEGLHIGPDHIEGKKFSE